MEGATGARTVEARVAQDESDSGSGGTLAAVGAGLATALESCSDLVAAVGLDWRYVACNAAYRAEFLRIYGREVEVGADLREAVAHVPGEAERAQALLSRAMGGESFRCEEMFGRHGGSRAYELVFDPLRDGAGRIVGAVWVGRDVRRRMEAERERDELRRELEQRVEARTAALARSEERLRLATEAADIGTWSRWAPGDRSEISEVARRIFGLAEGDELTPSRLFSLTHPDDRGALEELGRRVEHLPEGERIELTHRIVRTDGVQRWVQMHGEVLTRTPQGRVRLAGTIQDVTERVEQVRALARAEAEASRRLAELEAVYATAPVGLGFVDADLRYVRVNRRLCEINEASEAEHIGRTIAEIMPGELGQRVLATHRRVLQTGRAVVDLEVTGETPGRPGERRHWLTSYHPLRLASGEVAGVNVVVQDVTGQKRIEEALRESERRLALATGVARIGTFDWDFRRGVAVWSSEMEALHGLPPGTYDGSNERWLELVHPEDRRGAEAALAEGVRSGSYRAEWRVVWADGTVRWLESRGMVVTEGGEPRRMVGVNFDITGHKEAEAAARASEARLSAVMDALADGLVIADMNGRIVSMNPAAVEMHGFRGDEWAADLSAMRPRFRLFDEQGREVAYERWPLNRALAGERFQGWEALLRDDTTGREWWNAYSGTPVTDASGRTQWGIITVRDVTERRRAEAALRESETRFRRMADAAPAVLWVSDERGRATFLSRGWYEYTGQKADTAHGIGWLDPVHPDDLEQARAAWVAAYARAEAFRVDYRLRRADGAYRWVVDEGRPRFGEDGALLGYVGSVTEIHDRKVAEEALRESEGRLRALADSVPHLVWSVLPDGTNDFWNARLREYTGVREACPLPAAVWRELVHPEDRDRLGEELARAAAEGTGYSVDFRIRRAVDGAWRWHLAQAEAVRDTAGRVVRWYGTATDIHERHEAAERERVLNAELSHRVKNTLATVVSIATASLSEGSVPEEIRAGFLGRVRALAALHAVLARGEWREATLPEVLEAAVRPLAGERLSGAGEAIAVNPKAATVISMVLHELATNAAKHGALTRASGRVRVSWELRAAPEGCPGAGPEEGGEREPGTAEGAGMELVIRWEEAGGPEVSEPRERGYGSRFIERAGPYELGGRAVLEFRAEGVAFEMCCPWSERVRAADR